jgi:hypothetical protein
VQKVSTEVLVALASGFVVTAQDVIVHELTIVLDCSRWALLLLVASSEEIE